jgi:DNA-binding winged helix-turn-helix (wHTH) protein
MNKIVKLWKRYFGREKRLSTEIQELRRAFQVQEKAGSLYLTVNNVAYLKVNCNVTATAIAALLEEARQAAEAFKKAEA